MSDDHGGSIPKELAELSNRISEIRERLLNGQQRPVVIEELSPTYGSYAAAIVKNRAKLRRRLPAYLFGDPAFDMLLELFAAGERGDRLCAKSIGLAADVPATTALRWIGLLEKDGLVKRSGDPEDGRRTLLMLTPHARDVLHQWLADISSLPLRRD